jgi:regulator of protease activity HflC (stomatin/prohibitin superfamily)
MKADYITYKQATSVSIGGLVLQTLIASTFLIFGLLSRDTAAVTASIFAWVGVAAWLCLAIVYDQHRRERVEAIESDAMATSELAGTSVFSSSADEFRPAAKRLAMLYKFFVPAVSVIIGIGLAGLGLMRVLNAKETLALDQFTPLGMRGWAMGLGLGIGALGFVFARYAAGHARHAPWANLRAGASFAIGSALLGLAIGIAAFLSLMKNDTGVRYMQVIAPAFIFLVGLETIFHFVLGMYRPRRSGEMPRPAFDSRLLGLLAAPDQIARSISDAINYQLGFDVTSGWFYKLLSRALVPLFFFGLIVVWLLSAVAVIRPHQRGLILRFGSVSKADVAPGVHFKWPWPIETVYIPEYFTRNATNGRLTVTDETVTGLRRIELGTSPPATPEPILWTNDHAGEEVYQLVRTARRANVADSKEDLSDFSMVSAEIPLQYVVSDVLLFDELGPAAQRDDILKAVAQRELVRFFQKVTLDDVLGGERVKLSSQMLDQVQAAFDRLNIGADGKPRGAGVKVLHLGIVGAHPPRTVATAFETPVQADQKREANIEAAHADGVKALTEVAGDVATAKKIVDALNTLDDLRDKKATAEQIRDQEFVVQKLLESAGGSAAAALSKAQAERWSRHMSIRGMAARQQGRVALFNAAPNLYKAREYFGTLQDIMKDARVYITPEKGLMLDYDLKDKDFGQDIFKNNTIGDPLN